MNHSTDIALERSMPAQGVPRPALLAVGMIATMAAAMAAAGLASAQDPVRDTMTEAQIRTSLEAQGYTNINDVKFKDGAWKADARSADGNRVDVRVDAITGKVYPETQVANLTKADVQAKLAGAGYFEIHDIEFRNGVWEAEAEDQSGKDFELRLDAATGDIISKRKD
ncbi:MAG: PepSY domain-containing protein [Pseudomonadota bacterium]